MLTYSRNTKRRILTLSAAVSLLGCDRRSAVPLGNRVASTGASTSRPMHTPTAAMTAPTQGPATAPAISEADAQFDWGFFNATEASLDGVRMSGNIPGRRELHPAAGFLPPGGDSQEAQPPVLPPSAEEIAAAGGHVSDASVSPARSFRPVPRVLTVYWFDSRDASRREQHQDLNVPGDLEASGPFNGIIWMLFTDRGWVLVPKRTNERSIYHALLTTADVRVYMPGWLPPDLGVRH